MIKHEARFAPGQTALERAYQMVVAYLANLDREWTPEEDEARHALHEVICAQDQAELEAKWREEARREREARRKAKRLAKGGVWRAD
ncbi:MAG: hypothetical protein AB1609_11085 [Bacillota bacterium]